MKRIIALTLTALFLVLLVACNGDGGESSVDLGDFPSRTSAFYGTMDVNSFYFTMNFTNHGETYEFTQATNGKAVTTIEDHEDNSLDKYQIYQGNAVHKLYPARNSYDTWLGGEGQGFLFDGYTASMFANPSSVSESEFEGKKYYCESFVTQSMTGNGVAGVNNYYFDGERLAVVEIIDNGRTVMVMRFNDYSNTIPENIYLSAPSDFKPGSLEIEASDITYDDSWGWDTESDNDNDNATSSAVTDNSYFAGTSDIIYDESWGWGN